MKFAVGTGRNERIDEVAGIARAAEESGFSYLTFLDEQNLARDLYAMMTIAAANTSHIRIGQGVTVPFTRHPSVTANATATVDELSGGRVILGIGSGGGALGTMGMKTRPLAELREMVEFIRGYSAGEEAEFQGARMRSEWIRRPLTIYLSGGGPRMLQMAGEIADGVILSSNFGIEPIATAWKIEQIERGAVRAGRDPSEIDVWARAMMYVGDSREEARRAVAGYAVGSANSTVTRLRQSGPEIDDLRQRLQKAYPTLLEECERVYQARDPRRFLQFDSPSANLVSRQIVDLYHLAGTPDDIGEKLARLQELGVNTVATTLYSVVNKKGTLRRLGETIVARFES